MNDASRSGSTITVRRVEQGNCSPKGVQIEFKESINRAGNPNMEYLWTLLEAKGYEVADGAGIENTPFLRLCVERGERQIQRDEVIAILREDPRIDLSGVDQPEGTQS